MKSRSFLNLSVLVLFLFLAGCGKDDPKPNVFIVGKWGISDVNYEITVGDMTMPEYLKKVIGLSDADVAIFMSQMNNELEADFTGEIEFKADGTYESKDDISTETGKWELTADLKTLTTDKGTTSEQVLTISSHTDTKMTLKGNVEMEDTDGEVFVDIVLEMTKK